MDPFWYKILKLINKLLEKQFRQKNKTQENAQIWKHWFWSVVSKCDFILQLIVFLTIFPFITQNWLENEIQVHRNPTFRTLPWPCRTFFCISFFPGESKFNSDPYQGCIHIQSIFDIAQDDSRNIHGLQIDFNWERTNWVSLQK